MSNLIKNIPLHVITNPVAALIGAAQYGVVHLLSHCKVSSWSI